MAKLLYQNCDWDPVLHYFLSSNSHTMYNCIQQFKGSVQLIPRKQNISSSYRAETNWPFRGGTKWCKPVAVPNKYIGFWKFQGGIVRLTPLVAGLSSYFDTYWQKNLKNYCQLSDKTSDTSFIVRQIYVWFYSRLDSEMQRVVKIRYARDLYIIVRVWVQKIEKSHK